MRGRALVRYGLVPLAAALLVAPFVAGDLSAALLPTVRVDARDAPGEPLPTDRFVVVSGLRRGAAAVRPERARRSGATIHLPGYVPLLPVGAAPDDATELVLVDGPDAPPLGEAPFVVRGVARGLDAELHPRLSPHHAEPLPFRLRGAVRLIEPAAEKPSATGPLLWLVGAAALGLAVSVVSHRAAAALEPERRA